MNVKKLAYKLQTALCQKGRYIKINQYQFYSPKAGRMATKFVMNEKITLESGKSKTVTIMETYSMADIVMELARIYGGG